MKVCAFVCVCLCVYMCVCVCACVCRDFLETHKVTESQDQRSQMVELHS